MLIKPDEVQYLPLGMAKANLELYEYDRQSIQYELWHTLMGRPQIAQSRPKFYGAKGAPLAPWAMWQKKGSGQRIWTGKMEGGKAWDDLAQPVNSKEIMVFLIGIFKFHWNM